MIYITLVMQQASRKQREQKQDRMFAWRFDSARTCGSGVPLLPPPSRAPHLAILPTPGLPVPAPRFPLCTFYQQSYLPRPSKSLFC